MTTLTLHQLQWRHRAGNPVSLTLMPFQRLGILGANGSGKTSLLHTIMGLTPPLSGEVLLDQTPLSHHTPKERAKLLGILFQDNAFTYPQTVYDYCLASRYPHGASSHDHAHVEATLALLALTPFKNRRLTDLSGGEKRRVSIAALLVQAPRIFLLDEPQNHLDLAHQHHVLTHFKPSTLIMTLHEPNLAARYCTHLLLLFNDGSHLYGECKTLMTEANLSRLYGCSLSLQTQAFWSVAANYGIKTHPL